MKWAYKSSSVNSARSWNSVDRRGLFSRESFSRITQKSEYFDRVPSYRVNRNRQYIWTWLSITLYGLMVLVVQGLHLHDGDNCSTCHCTVSFGDDSCLGTTIPTDVAADDANPPRGRPDSPYEEDCPACRLLSQPKLLVAIVAPPELSETLESVSFLFASLDISHAWDSPPVRGPPTL